MTVSDLHGVSHTCFGLSYLLALGFAAAAGRWPRPELRAAGLLADGVGLATHTIYLALHPPAAAAPSGGLLLVAWVLAVFSLYGSLHHPKQAWAVFVLPVVLGLVGLSAFLIDRSAADSFGFPDWFVGERLWAAVHGLLLLAAAVGVSVGFLASVMYLVQARRVRRKTGVGGLPMFSLERLEAMNRRAVNAAFPLLTAGLLLGAVLLKREHDPAGHWLSLKIVGTAGLWVVFLVLLYLRYAAHVSGRKLAAWSIAAFALLVAVLAAAHPFAEGGR